MSPPRLPVPRSPEALTPAWLSAALADRLPAPVAAAEATRIGEGFGLAGRTYRIDVVLEDQSQLALVAKLCRAAHARREGRVYRELLPRTEVPVPRFLAAHAQDDGADEPAGVVLLAYVPDARQGDCLVGCRREEAVALAETLAALHAPYWDISLADAPAWLAPAPRPPADGPRPAPERIARCLARHGASMSEKGRALVQALPTRLPAAQGVLDRAPQAATHRDFHLDNVLFDAAGAPVILDWALAARGPAAVDVARLLAECVLARELDAVYDAVLDAYLAALAARGAGPYPRAALERDLRAAALLQLAGAVGWAGAPEPPPAGTREADLPASLLRGCLATIRRAES